MTKAQLAQRVAELEAAQPSPRELPLTAITANTKAHQLGVATRTKAVTAGRKTRTGVVIASSAVSGFFAGLFGK